MSSKFEEDVLRALRQITRAIDLHSRHLATTFGLTAPQLVCLRVIAQQGPMTPTQLAHEVSLSQGTITGIVDRLVSRQLVERERACSDRRMISLRVSDAGRSLIAAAPSPLQERFVKRLGQLEPDELEVIRSTLTKIVRMMDGAADIDAAPVLSSEETLASPASAPASPSQPVSEPPLRRGGREPKTPPGNGSRQPE